MKLYPPSPENVSSSLVRSHSRTGETAGGKVSGIVCKLQEYVFRENFCSRLNWEGITHFESNDLAGNFPPSSCGCLFPLQRGQARAWQPGEKCQPQLCHLKELPALQWLRYRGQNYSFTVKPSKVKPYLAVNYTVNKAGGCLWQQ